MFYNFAIVVTAGATAATPVSQVLKLTKGIIHRVEIEFPAGCRGYVSLALKDDGHQFLPTNPEGAFCTDNYTIVIDEHYPIDTAPYQLRAVAWAPSADYDHTITVRIGILRADVLSPFMSVAKALAKFLERLGYKP